MIPLETCECDFEADGSVRDILVCGTTIDHWRRCYAFLKVKYPLEYQVDGQSQTLPATIEEAFTTGRVASQMLRFRVGGVTVICHFFTENEIEFDIDPRDVNSQASLDELLSFIMQLGNIVNLRVNLCWEGDTAHPFIVYDPSTKTLNYCGRAQLP